ncbi:MAG: hypothetical protein Q9M17_04320 [Mariprofundus sp.]|nr:hypothetical protein [Mariprofundus sp.]
MLLCLNDWRAQCSAEQLASFEELLSEQCSSAISKATIKNRYAGYYHKALISDKVFLSASQAESFALRPVSWSSDMDAGIELTRKIAKHDGVIAIAKAEGKEIEAAIILLQRGVIFEHDGHYCLPAECLHGLNTMFGHNIENEWISLVSNTPAAMLHQIVPAQAKVNMLQPKASHNELVAWLIVHGQQARTDQLTDQLDESDWSLLLLLQQADLNDFESLQQRYPDLPCIEITKHYFYNDRQEFSLRKSLEKHIPAQLIKLYRLGLIGIITYSGDNMSATITLSVEAETALKPHWDKMRKRISKQLQSHWLATECVAEYLSAWAMDQELWRVWIVLHFLPLGITQQRKLRKNDIKKIAALLREEHVSHIECFIFSMLSAGLIEQQDNALIPCPVDWLQWRKLMRANICKDLRSWDEWEESGEKQALKLLSQLPTECWLKLDEVIEWLRSQSDSSITGADWISLFTQHQSHALHHFNNTLRTIYLLPEFRAVVLNKAVSFPAPGWIGASNKAKVHGFLSAAGDIQLPPDCKHTVLNQLAECCAIKSVEQMITLQLDQKNLQRMATDKAALKKTRALLESLQSPLPQAVNYMFDKQQAQQAVATVAATSMVVVMHDASAIHSLRKTGFEFSQPFRDKPEILVLSASADAQALINACNDAGILLDTLIKPVQWISGMAAVNAWMQVNLDREDQWLEIAYQKTLASAPKQIFARIDADYYGAVRIQPCRKVKLAYALQKNTLQLQAKHVLRLRELDDAETTELGLDQLR